jgi:hypothetical protein
MDIFGNATSEEVKEWEEVLDAQICERGGVVGGKF